MPVQIQLRRDTAADWTSVDPTLAEGELGIETDTDKVKIGDGATAWTSLPYFSPGVSEITDIPTSETDTALVLAPDGVGGVEFRAESGGVADILDLPTAETDTALVLAPDGAGGVEFRAETGGGGGGSSGVGDKLYLYTNFR